MNKIVQYTLLKPQIVSEEFFLKGYSEAIRNLGSLVRLLEESLFIFSFNEKERTGTCIIPSSINNYDSYKEIKIINVDRILRLNKQCLEHNYPNIEVIRKSHRHWEIGDDSDRISRYGFIKIDKIHLEKRMKRVRWLQSFIILNGLQMPYLNEYYAVNKIVGETVSKLCKNTEALDELITGNISSETSLNHLNKVVKALAKLL